MTTGKLLSWIMVATFGAMTSHGAAAVDVARESRSVAGFDRVELRAIGELVIDQGATESLVIEAEKSLVPKISTEVKGGTLYFDFTERQISTQKPIRYFLTIKNLTSVTSVGSGSTSVSLPTHL